MPLYLDGKIIRNTEEQVQKNKDDIEELLENSPLELKDKVDTLEVDNQENKTNIAENAEKINVLDGYFDNTFEIETQTVTITYDQWSENRIDLTNEFYDTNYIIMISPTPDDSSLTNNSYNISYYKIRPLAQVEDGKITLVCDERPAEGLEIKLDFVIFIPFVKEGA